MLKPLIKILGIGISHSMRDQNGVFKLFDNAGSLNQDLSYWCFPTGGNASQIYQNRQKTFGGITTP